MKKYLVIGLIAATFFSCSQAVDMSNYTISGTITNAPANSKLFLERLSPLEVKTIDTALVNEDGSFGFEIGVEEVGFYRVKQDDKKFITLILQPGEKLVVNTAWNLGVNPYTVEGSQESLNLMGINRRMSDFYTKRDSLTVIFKANDNNQEVVNQLQMDYISMVNENVDYVRQFITENPGSFASLAAAEQLNPDTDYEYFIMIDEALGERYGNSPYYAEFHKVVAKMSLLAIGAEAPEILLPNAQGETIALSSLRGKVVLIDFWASWCKPCRMENPNVVRAYNEYKDKGFEIYGVSLDKEKGNWLQAIQQDNMTWIHVSDLKFWNSSVVKLYDIQGIPLTLLLDREGKILAKNLRGPDLAKKLAEVLN